MNSGLSHYPGPEDVLVPARLQVADVLLAQEAGVGHDRGLGEAETLLQLLDDGDHHVPLVRVAGMYLVPYRVAAGTDQQTEHYLRIGVLPVLGPAVDADVVLAGLEVHRGRVIEDHRHRAAEDPPGLVVGLLLHVVLDVVGAFAAPARPPAQLVQKAVDLVLVVELVHKVGHIAERLQLAPRTVQACDHQALEQLVV